MLAGAVALWATIGGEPWPNHLVHEDQVFRGGVRGSGFQVSYLESWKAGPWQSAAVGSRAGGDRAVCKLPARGEGGGRTEFCSPTAE